VGRRKSRKILVLFVNFFYCLESFKVLFSNFLYCLNLNVLLGSHKHTHSSSLYTYMCVYTYQVPWMSPFLSLCSCCLFLLFIFFRHYYIGH
jgi:hypothetical protein